MGWSTRELPQIADTTVNTVRHYHRVGLLPAPDRSPNGYRQYGLPHLLRLLRIRRLGELGVSLARIADMDESRGEATEDLLALHAELEATITRLTRVRAEIAELLRHEAPPETPQGFAALSPELSETQRALLSVYATVFDDATLAAFAKSLGRGDETDRELDRLPVDVDDTVVDDLARRMVPVTLRQRAEHPELADPLATSPLGRETAGDTIARALVELYHPAQLRVLHRLDELLRQGSAGDRPERTG